MSSSTVITALQIPSRARIDQRVPKKLLTEQAAPTSADRRIIQDSIEDLIWVAALKPTNIGVPVYRDDQREYLEIAVLTATIRFGLKSARLIELIHRAIPYPLFLVSSQPEGVTISLSHIRHSEGQTGKTVIEDLRRTAPFSPDQPASDQAAFLASLPISEQPKNDMYALYQGWMTRLLTLEASAITGVYEPLDTPGRVPILREGLDEYARITRDIAALRAEAAKQKQLNRLVEINLTIKRLESELADIETNL